MWPWYPSPINEWPTPDTSMNESHPWYPMIDYSTPDTSMNDCSTSRYMIIQHGPDWSIENIHAASLHILFPVMETKTPFEWQDPNGDVCVGACYDVYPADEVQTSRKLSILYTFILNLDHLLLIVLLSSSLGLDFGAESVFGILSSRYISKNSYTIHIVQ